MQKQNRMIIKCRNKTITIIWKKQKSSSTHKYKIQEPGK